MLGSGLVMVLGWGAGLDGSGRCELSDITESNNSS